MPPIGAGWLMMLVFNLVKCCRDQGFGICMEGIALHRPMGTMGLERPTTHSLFVEHIMLCGVRQGILQRANANIRKIPLPLGGVLAGTVAVYFHT